MDGQAIQHQLATIGIPMKHWDYHGIMRDKGIYQLVQEFFRLQYDRLLLGIIRMCVSNKRKKKNIFAIDVSEHSSYNQE